MSELTVREYGACTPEAPPGESAPVIHEPAAFTAPPPVRYATRTSPGCAGLAAVFIEPFGFWTMASLPSDVKNPGAAEGMVSVTLLLGVPPFITVNVTACP